MNGGLSLPSPYRVVCLDEVDSTNDEAKRLAEGGAPEFTVVWAHAQRRGRGRRRRSWASPPGNLYLSLVMRPNARPAVAAQLAFVATLALHDGLRALLRPPIDLVLKWPNDLLLNGRKVSGMLLESAMAARGAVDWLVIGVGVNVASHPASADFPATSLRAEGFAKVTPEDVLEGFARHFRPWVARWRVEGFRPVRTSWLKAAHGVGEAVTVRLDRERLEGRFADLDETGALVLALPDGAYQKVTAGEVFFPEAR
ncbi:MAG: biotin--[acetyl-CoA-carboxylase] ligase [Alphaproteobacteria bacterium]